MIILKKRNTFFLYYGFKNKKQNTRCQKNLISVKLPNMTVV